MAAARAVVARDSSSWAFTFMAIRSLKDGALPQLLQPPEPTKPAGGPTGPGAATIVKLGGAALNAGEGAAAKAGAVATLNALNDADGTLDWLTKPGEGIIVTGTRVAETNDEGALVAKAAGAGETVKLCITGPLTAG